MLKHIFGVAEYQKNCTFGLGYKMTITRNEDDAVLDKTPVIAGARIKIDLIQWCVPHYTPSIPQQVILSKQILSKTPTEIRYFERSVFIKEVNNQNLWNFELGSQVNVPIWIIMRFQQRNRQVSQDLKNVIFCR